jgi:hypothetical protein
MKKPYIPKNHKFHYLCNEVFHSVRDKLIPSGRLRDSFKFNKTLAFGLGALATFTTLSGADYVLELFKSPVTLETIASEVTTLAVGAPIVAEVTMPSQMKEMRGVSPRYTAGLYGLAFGTAARSLIEFL